MQELCLEDFVARGREATGKAACDLIHEATAAPGLFVFGELLALGGVQDLANDPALAGHLQLLRIFAFGTLPEYRESCETDRSIPSLTRPQELKLKLLTVASLAEQVSVLPYAVLKTALEMQSTRALEDLLINECVSTGLVKGKLDQKKARFEVHRAMPRDLKPGRLPELIDELSQWRDHIGDVLKGVAVELKNTKENSELQKLSSKRVAESVEKTERRVRLEFEKGDKQGGGVRGGEWCTRYGGPKRNRRRRRRVRHDGRGG
jgi:COP9 signalosome complex subunit 7